MYGVLNLNLVFLVLLQIQTEIVCLNESFKRINFFVATYWPNDVTCVSFAILFVFWTVTWGHGHDSLSIFLILHANLTCLIDSPNNFIFVYMFHDKLSLAVWHSWTWFSLESCFSVPLYYGISSSVNSDYCTRPLQQYYHERHFVCWL